VRDGKGCPAWQGDSNPSSTISPGGSLPGSPDEKELVRRARDGDSKAIEELVFLHQAMVFATAYRLCDFDREEARDAAQDAFVQVFRKIGQFEGRSSFATWLHRIVVNTCLLQRRRKARRSRFFFSWWPFGRDEEGDGARERDWPVPEDGSNPADDLLNRELKRDVVSALKGLSQRQRTVFQLKVFEEMTIPEIAAATGMAEGTVKSHLFRAMRAVRHRLAGWDNSE
jgi:RNA polymerase sigma-70 factor (ECF subfamily)